MRLAGSLRPRLAGILLALAAAACAPEAGPPEGGEGARATEDAGETRNARVTITDAVGREVVLRERARRIVSLVPSVNQILVEIGAADRLVGRTDYDTLSTLRGLPSVGGGLGPDLETLATLQPDLVVRFAGDSDTATPEWLDELGVPHLAVRPDRIADVFEIIEWMGSVTGRGEAAAGLRGELEAELDAVAAAVSGLPPVRTVYLMGGTPPWTAGGGTFIDELIAVAGGRNVFDDLERLYAPVSPEVLATRRVDVVLVSSTAEVDERILRGRAVRRVSERVQLPGPWLGAAAWEVARALHPEAGPGGPP